MSQTAISTSMRKALAGSLAGTGEHDVHSRVNEDANEIAFGAGVARGAGDDGVIRIDSAADAAKFDGVLVHVHAYEVGTQVGTTGLKSKVNASVLRRGRIAVACEDVCVRGDGLRVRHTAGAGGTVLGGFRKAAVAGETLDVSKVVKVIEGNGSAGGIAIVEVDCGNDVGAADT